MIDRRSIVPAVVAGFGLLVSLLCGSVWANADAGAGASGFAGTNAFMKRYCGRCHNEERFAGYWALVDVDPNAIARGEQLNAWEKILRMTHEGDMPPPERKKQPTESERAQFVATLRKALDGYSQQHPNPGRATLRRLNRAEYANAVRDLLHIEMDLAASLPADDSGYGFDNIADVLSVSATLMDRYFAVAGRVSRLALGLGPQAPVLTSFKVAKDGSILNQGIPSFNERTSRKLPLDSRGGAAFDFYVPHDGDYEIAGYLNANTNNEVDRLEENRHSHRVFLTAGSHSLGMSFRRKLRLDESTQTLRNNLDIVPLPGSPPGSEPLDFIVDGARVHSVAVPEFHESPRFAQKNFLRDLLQLDVQGPFNKLDARSSAPQVTVTPNARKILRCQPGASRKSQLRCASKILRPMARQAYRRPLANNELEPLLAVFDRALQQEDFAGAIATAVQALLVSPQFLFVVEQRPAGLLPDTNYPISDLEFATRLSLFLWSSLPDAELLALAERKRLRRPRVLRKQLARMLADPKAEALTANFAGQWLFLRNLDYHQVDVDAYPQFDVRLRTAMRGESEQFFAAILRENRSLLEFLDADYSYLNERLAAHYGVAGVYGPEMRRVRWPEQMQRGGLLGQASLLTLTSYGNHTSVVRRGQWILDALLAAPPPPPPPDVPALVAEKAGAALSAREQLALHRSEPACASCHVKMDPLGLSLERFDAIGGYRTVAAGRSIDVSTSMPDGTAFSGLSGLQAVLLERKDQFTRAFTEQLMTYALGRGIEAHDRPAIRAVAEAAAADEYRIQRVILGIVQSYAFNHRRTPSQ
ncbi:MAG: DUF1592 domain-containing protein [Pseudomonadales bacterium]